MSHDCLWSTLAQLALVSTKQAFSDGEDSANQVRATGGIPLVLRPNVWMVLSGAGLRRELWPGHYEDLLSYYADDNSTAITQIHKVFLCVICVLFFSIVVSHFRAGFASLVSGSSVLCSR